MKILSLLFVLCCSLPGIAAANNKDMTESGQLELGLALGYGEIQNPVKGEDNLATLVLPSISYYDDHFFVENFTLGYSLFENDDFYLDVIGSLNSDGLFFNDGAFTSVAAVSRFGDRGGFTEMEIPETVERDISYLGGLSATWLTDIVQVRLSHVRDISGVHHGYETKLNFSRFYDYQWIQLNWKIEFVHKSSKITNYYYQYTKAEIGYQAFKLDDAINTEFGLDMAIPINDHWSFINFISYTKLDDDLEDSFILEDTSYWTGFSGFRYLF